MVPWKLSFSLTGALNKKATFTVVHMKKLKLFSISIAAITFIFYFKIYYLVLYILNKKDTSKTVKTAEKSDYPNSAGAKQGRD